MKHGVPDFIARYATIWLIGVMGALALGGAMAYLDLRHVQRIEFNKSQHVRSELRLLDKIDEADSQIERLELYNRLGSQANQPARNQIIIQQQNRKGKWERELDLLQKDQ